MASPLRGLHGATTAWNSAMYLSGAEGNLLLFKKKTISVFRGVVWVWGDGGHLQRR